MLMNYTLSNISNILGGEKIVSNIQITELLTDSRSLINADQTLFFAIRTSSNDGHKYIKHLYDQGVKAFCVEYIPDNMAGTDANFIVVNSTTDALQRIAAFHRQTFEGSVVAITGSHGKTIIKEWIYQMLSEHNNIVRSPRSYNSQIGVPLSVWQISNEADMAIIEAGISRQGEMAQLEKIIKPTVGIITNIDDEHDDGFISQKAKCDEKVSLMRNCRAIIYCKDDKLINESVKNICVSSDDFGWSTIDRTAKIFISEIISTVFATKITYLFNNKICTCEFNLTQSYDIHNALHCLALLLYIGKTEEDVQKCFSKLSPISTRLSVIEAYNNSHIVYDTYTSDIHSLSPAIDFMQSRETKGKICTVILSEIKHENLPIQSAYKRLAELLERKNVSRLIGIGDKFNEYSSFFNMNIEVFKDVEHFLSTMSTGDFNNEIILIKGSPESHFERIVDKLEARQHETMLEVNLDALIHNYNLFKSKVRPETGVVCMLKASGYGAGSFELAKTLQLQGAAYIAVAVLDEGVELRKAGITMPIMVLNPRVVNYQSLFNNKLEPEIFNFEVLNEIINEGKKYNIHDYPIHIKLDTGMHRLGFTAEDIDKLTEVLRGQDVVKPSSIFSHLATADCLDMDDYTMMQFDVFEKNSSKIQSAFDYHINRHILNSTGISRFPQYQYDMVRLGICLYGIPTVDDGSQIGLKEVSSLVTNIISIKKWEKGTSIGYSRRGVCQSDSTIATIPIGYADGVNRHLGNGKLKVYINGAKCPTIGNICMDACMIDVTGVNCNIGDKVEIFGPHTSVIEIASILDTIPYEILTSISTRVKRVYYRE